MIRAELSDLAIFASIARHRSFRRAATELGLSTSALSHALKGLEARLGIRLLHRTSRSVAPTEAGEALLKRLAPALAEIGAAVDEAASMRDGPSGTLKINAPRSVCRLLLLPLVTRFLAACPRVRVEVVADDALTDIVARGFDAGVRIGERLAGDMIAVPLSPPQRFVVVGAPAYLEARGLPQAPHELIGHACLRQRFPGGEVLPWGFVNGKESFDVSIDGPLILGDQELILDAVLAGLGLAYIFEAYAKPAVEAGRAISVLDAWCPAFPGFFLYYPGRRHPPPALRAFIDMIRRGDGV